MLLQGTTDENPIHNLKSNYNNEQKHIFNKVELLP